MSLLYMLGHIAVWCGMLLLHRLLYIIIRLFWAIVLLGQQILLSWYANWYCCMVCRVLYKDHIGNKCTLIGVLLCYPY